MDKSQKLGITDVILRDAHQSILATRMRVEDMLPIAEKLDQVGFWSLESWGGATFDSCIRYLGEDPWERIRVLKSAMPNTPQQMLLRGQNILGYRHYADDVVEKFVERAATNGVDVFRIFDAMNDMRNLTTAIKATLAVDKHAQGTISYTVSPVHTIQMWVDLAKEIEDMGAHSLCIKDMAGLLKPYVAFDLVSRLKASLGIPIHMQCHATTGMSTATYVKAIEAGIDNVDTSISSISMTYGHSATESLVAILEDEERDTGLDLNLLEEIAGYFRQVRKKYAQFEGAMRGVDSRILVAQVPGGMLTNLESQLREQNASGRLDEVLDEIPEVRKDLGYIPLVTPTSQIVGTQAVMNVLSGERYKNVTKETLGVLAGEYGITPAPLNAELQKNVLGEVAPITCRPADLLKPELAALAEALDDLARKEGIELAEQKIDDVLTYALFPQVGAKFLMNRNEPSAFEPSPTLAIPLQPAVANSAAVDNGSSTYTVTVDGIQYSVQIEEGSGSVAERLQISQSAQPQSGEWMNAGLAGTVHQVLVKVGDVVAAGEKILVLEAMKMETDVSAAVSGKVAAINISAGDQVSVGQALVLINSK
jgi:oxaloacetate decarboxylase alpha subunit